MVGMATLPTEARTSIEYLERELQMSQQENRMLREEISWFENLLRLPTSTISPSEQKTVYALHKAAQGRDPDTFFKVDTRELSESVGQSQGTFLHNTATVAKNLGVVEKKLEEVWYSNGVNEDGSDKRSKYTHLYVRPLELLDYPRLYTPQVERNHGGKREGAGRKPKCRTCQSEHLAVTEITRYRCLDCHDVWYEQGEEILPSAANNQVEYSDDDDVESSLAEEPPDPADNQVEKVGTKVSDELPTADNQVENENTLAEVQVDALLPTKEDYQLETVDPSILPLPLDARSVEAAACELLLEIAGPGPEHIEMNKDPDLDRKYTTIHRPLHKGDMLAHLRGVRTKGATLRHPLGLTRALCFDVDNAGDWLGLKHDAALLARAGFKPMLEPSPTQGEHVGGGHLWIVFDKLVDALDAHQTVIDIAATGLAEVKEYWPNGGNRVRLPGGKYMTPGYEAWCHLYDDYWNELSHDGASAARVLVEMQTPADRVLVEMQTPADRVRRHEEKTELVLTQEATTQHAPHKGGILGEKADVLPHVLAEFEYSWEQLADMAGGLNADGYFPAKWRGDGRIPNVKEWGGHDLATDFSSQAWTDCKCMDRHHVWCLLQAGENWREFRRLDLDQRCRAYRERQEGQAS